MQSSTTDQGLAIGPSVNSVKLPPLVNGTKGSDGGGGVAGKALSQQLIYRSVPPRPFSYTMSDMLGSTLAPRNGMRKPKGISLSMGTPSEYAERFKSKPTTQPKVIEFDGGNFSGESRRRKFNGFFPPVKIRQSAKGHHSGSPSISVEKLDVDGLTVLYGYTWKTAPGFVVPRHFRMNTTYSPDARMQLAPTTFTDLRARSARAVSRASRSSQMSNHTYHLRKTPESFRTVRTAPPDAMILYPNIVNDSFDCDDLSYLPPPKKILPKRELPWVFRYKVKRNMNELAKIMASKPQLVEQT